MYNVFRHGFMYMCIYIHVFSFESMVFNMVESQTPTNMYTFMRAHNHVYIYLSIAKCRGSVYLYIYIHVCVYIYM